MVVRPTFLDLWKPACSAARRPVYTVEPPVRSGQENWSLYSLGILVAQTGSTVYVSPSIVTLLCCFRILVLTRKLTRPLVIKPTVSCACQLRATTERYLGNFSFYSVNLPVQTPWETSCICSFLGYWSSSDHQQENGKASVFGKRRGGTVFTCLYKAFTDRVARGLETRQLWAVVVYKWMVSAIPIWRPPRS